MSTEASCLIDAMRLIPRAKAHLENLIVRGVASRPRAEALAYRAPLFHRKRSRTPFMRWLLALQAAEGDGGQTGEFLKQPD